MGEGHQGDKSLLLAYLKGLSKVLGLRAELVHVDRELGATIELLRPIDLIVYPLLIGVVEVVVGAKPRIPWHQVRIDSPYLQELGLCESSHRLLGARGGPLVGCSCPLTLGCPWRYNLLFLLVPMTTRDGRLDLGTTTWMG